MNTWTKKKLNSHNHKQVAITKTMEIAIMNRPNNYITRILVASSKHIVLKPPSSLIDVSYHQRATPHILGQKGKSPKCRTFDYRSQDMLQGDRTAGCKILILRRTLSRRFKHMDRHEFWHFETIEGSCSLEPSTLQECAHNFVSGFKVMGSCIASTTFAIIGPLNILLWWFKACMSMNGGEPTAPTVFSPQ